MTRPLSAALLAAASLALLAGQPRSLAAQITTGLTPPAPRPTRAQVAAAESAQVSVRDSIVLAERLDMRAWVDSAASSLERGGAPVTPMQDVPGDSLVPAAGPPATGTPATPAAPAGRVPPGAGATTTFREGAPAPATATPLPLLLVLGGSLAAAGAGLLRRR